MRARPADAVVVARAGRRRARVSGSGRRATMSSDIDVERAVAHAKTRLRALYGAQHVAVNHRAAGTSSADEPSSARDVIAAHVRGLFANDPVADAASAAMTRLAFCCVDARGGVRFWEYGAEWLARAERTLALGRIEAGDASVPASFVECGECSFEVMEDGDAWMPFERAVSAVGSRAARAVRDGYACVPREALAEAYAESVEREVRRDCQRAFRKLRAMMSTGDGPRALDPRSRLNALRAVRTYQPDPSELPYLPATGSTFARKRRERRRAGLATHAMAIEADGEASERASTRVGVELKRAFAALRAGASKVSTRPFPPCMRDKLSALRRTAHLKYADRFQLNLFFKAIGLDVSETLDFWRRGVFPRGRMRNYQKEHTYAIRHHYGLEGAMKDYTPHNCESLAKSVEGARACPFVGTVDEFRTASSSSDWFRELSFDGREAVELAVQMGDAKCACERVFADFHGGLPIGQEFTFPADFFDASLEIEDLYVERRRAHPLENRSAEADPAEGAATPPESDASAAAHPDALPENFRIDVEDASSDEDDDRGASV